MNKSYIDIMRGLREDNDKTQQDIADFLGISQTMYARYERGARTSYSPSYKIMSILPCVC